MRKTALLFPGQGSQIIGMGAEFYQEYDVVREIFDMAEETLKMHVSNLCFKGPMEDLTQTVNLQPAVTTVNLACLAVLNKEGVTYDFCAGHSLGEYSALNAAGVVSAEDTVKLVYHRGTLMHRESLKNKGAMHAIVGLPIGDVAALVAEVQPQGTVSVANHNSELQIVITGSPETVERVSALAGQKGAKAIPIKVSGAWHSELIKGAEEEFNALLSEINFHRPQKTLILNVTGEMATDADEIKAGMQQQLCSPVKWYDAINTLIQQKMDTFVEVGPGRVLTGLLKKIIPPDYPAKIYNVSNMKQLERFLKEIL
ncbi:MAG: ACP S-malonyltransferase [Desulfobacterales bacterium]|jgi:[acyl-carrier-protein] S-malonyltransferase